MGEGFNVTYGARPLRRAIQRHLETPLARGVLAGDFAAGDRIVADVNGAGDGLALAVATAMSTADAEDVDELAAAA